MFWYNDIAIQIDEIINAIKEMVFIIILSAL